MAARKLFTAFLVGLFFFLLDIGSKTWVAHLNTQGAKLPHVLFTDFFGIDLQITHAVNTGAAWGVFSEYPRLLVFFRILLIAGLVIYLTRFNKNPSCNIPLALIISGASGNVVDYFRYGHVVDMIQFRFWGYEYPV